ncbi:hypothetical protein, partial [Microcoleus anatoxicus]
MSIVNVRLNNQFVQLIPRKLAKKGIDNFDSRPDTYSYLSTQKCKNFMGDIQATFTSTDRAFHIEGYEKIDFSLLYVDGA